MNGLRTACALLLLCSVASPAQVQPAVSSEKGGFGAADVPAWPTQTVDLVPLTAQVAKAASRHCGSALAATALEFGELSLANVPAGAGKSAVGKLVGGLLGSPAGRSRPRLGKDPVAKKHKLKLTHGLRRAQLQLGGALVDGSLVLSARVAKAPAKNSFHTVFIERPDCQRLWPSRYEGYGLWGSWKLSVSVTKTTSRYRDGVLQDRTVDRSGFSRSGVFNPGSGFSIFSDPSASAESGRRLLAPRQAFLQHLQRSSLTPAWSELGYAEPTGGIRNVGAHFAVGADALPSGSVAIVHLAEQVGGQYTTIGFAARIEVDDGVVRLQPLTPDA